jgi:hypothetical protein
MFLHSDTYGLQQDASRLLRQYVSGYAFLPKDLPISEEKRAPELRIFKVQTLANGSFSAAFFIVDPTKEFNMNIDAPAEECEDLFA